jgi:histone-lysine N-methyltransferase SETMAR
LEKFGWENLDHPPYSPDLASSDFHLFSKIEEFLGCKRMATDEEAKETLNGFFKWTGGRFV